MDTINKNQYNYDADIEFPPYEPMETIYCDVCGSKVDIYAYANGYDDYDLSGKCDDCGEEYST